ncbi:MAG: hypothetical protein P1U47_05205 [Zhongshania sp.]|uniref:hypothetical protein n=1 Tax=Zhongshania sp. TaxID=1971902 RepID=UPI002605E094|nr:hypothetical protein [Zhongshania sp.]MDF1691745.1 hypothetical protein [Zhongshania sp.]
MSNTANDYLEGVCFEVIRVMADKDSPMGSAALSVALGIRHDAVQAAVCKLIIRDKLIMVGRCDNDRPVYLLRVPETEIV